MTKKNKLWIALGAVTLAIVLALGVFMLQSGGTANVISQEKAQTLIDDSFAKMPGAVATTSMKYIAENSYAKINSISYGDEKDIICNVTFYSPKVKDVAVDYFKEISAEFAENPEMKRKTSTQIKHMLSGELMTRFEASEVVSTEGTIVIYETKEGYKVYTSDEVVDLYFGGIVSAKKEIDEISDKKAITFKKGFLECIKAEYSDEKPETAGPIIKAWNKFKNDFYRNFIKDANWKYIVTGLWVTIRVTFFALLIGIFLGFLVAIIRCTCEKTGKLKICDAICRLYLTVVRGTPVLVQLMIIFFVVFMPMGVDKFVAAVVCFGLNSGAYVAEIVRGGIMSVDAGQTEAGRSLGFNYTQTMIYIVVPQAFKAVLPALANEFIVLLKETSVSAYIGLNDLARGGDIIRGVTYSAFMPLLAVAVIYLVMVIALSYLVGKLERRLRSSER